jgi:Flp pilus assembly protein TadD
MRSVLALFLLLPVVAAAKPQAAPQAKPAMQTQDQLFAQLKKAERPEDAKPIEDKLNAMFRASGSPSVDLLMVRVQASLGAADNATARKLILAVTRIAPRYAEGWHVRAGIAAAGDDDADALVSLQKVVLLNPRNFAALTELAGMVEDYGDKKAALKLYRQALDVDPQQETARNKVRELTTSVEGRDI